MSKRISSSEFLPLVRDQDTEKFTLDVRYDLCSGRGDLWGGVALAAAMNALSEQTEGRPIVWASAQFLLNKAEAQTLTLQTEIPVHSRSISQGTVHGLLDETDFIRVAACLGQRRGKEVADWANPAKVLPAKDCPDIELGKPRTAMHTHTELRLAHGMFGVTGQGTPSDDGRLSMWVRMPIVENDAGALAILADYMLSGIGNSLATVAYGVSLDNTIRIARLVQTDWVQCDITMQHISDGFGYGTSHLFSEDGVLMATANQSVIVRVPET